MNPLPQLSEMKLDPDLEGTPRRSYEGLDPSDLECAITRLRDANFGVLLPCLHDFSLSGIRVLPSQSCPICRTELEDYANLNGLDTEIEKTKKLLQRMEKAREKVATINRVNEEYLVGHADERNDVKAARINSTLSEGDLPRLFGEENAIPNQSLAEINRSNRELIRNQNNLIISQYNLIGDLNRAERLHQAIDNKNSSMNRFLIGTILSGFILNQICETKDIPFKFFLSYGIISELLDKIIDIKNPNIKFLLVIVIGMLIYYGSREAMKISYDAFSDLSGNLFLKFN